MKEYLKLFEVFVVGLKEGVKFMLNFIVNKK
jgi:hypothetical protein